MLLLLGCVSDIGYGTATAAAAAATGCRGAAHYGGREPTRTGSHGRGRKGIPVIQDLRTDRVHYHRDGIAAGNARRHLGIGFILIGGVRGR